MIIVNPRSQDVRLALVLSGGGLRGAAHVGVLRQLVRHGIPLHAIVGVSAGAVIGAYYAAVGLTLDELLADAESFRGRHLLAYSLNVQSGYRLERRFDTWCGVIPARLRQLELATFDRLHHGVQRLGVVCHDVTSNRPCYFASGADRGLRLHEAVRASASIPRLFPAISVQCDGQELRLTDGGVSDDVPVAFARDPIIGATHVIVSDARWLGRVPATDDATVWIRARTAATGTIWSPHRGLLATVRSGEAAVTDDVLGRIRRWFPNREPNGHPDQRIALPTAAAANASNATPSITRLNADTNASSIAPRTASR
jgi:predicted acylesterase/phospholipase RssA